MIAVWLDANVNVQQITDRYKSHDIPERTRVLKARMWKMFEKTDELNDATMRFYA